MSSSSLYEPDDNSTSDSDHDSVRVPRRRPVSRAKAYVTDDTTMIGLGEEGGMSKHIYKAQKRYENMHIRAEKLNSTSLEAYTRLLAAEGGIVSKVGDDNWEHYKATQNGAVTWTSAEKETFFRVLDRKGLNGIKEIAAAIQTKSELEVVDYIKLIQRGLEAQHILERQMGTIVMGDIPAAAEISVECCDELDKYADVLAGQEETNIISACRLKYGNNSIISDVQAQALRNADASRPLRGSIHLAASVLNVPTWIQLSRRFFMNFGGSRKEDNWTNIIQSEEESPSMTGDALMDFYALTMSITRRLVHSTVFFAKSRIRSTQVAGRGHKDRIRKRDVQAAIDVLNMKHKRSGFLVDFARRNGLTIADITNRKGWVPRVLSYDEAEEIIDHNTDYFVHGPDSCISSELEDEDHESDNAVYSEAEDSNSETSTSRSSRLSSPELLDSSSQKLSEEEDPLFDAEEEHAANLDRDFSRREELKLWSLLEKPGPATLQMCTVTEGETDSTRKLIRKRKSREELVNWRDRTLYRSEWEEYGAGLEDLLDELAENRRKRRQSEEDPFSPSASNARRKYEQAEEISFGYGVGAKDLPPRSASVVNSDDSLGDGAETV